MLLAHCNTNYISEDEVLAVPAPAGTKTWQPISHAELINNLSLEVQIHGFEIIRKEYSLSRDGSQMFGVWTIASCETDMTYALGFRNSTNKRLSVGLVAGTKVFVCDNLAFSGDFLVFRRHTSGISRDLTPLIRKALWDMQERLDAFMNWHKRLINYCLPRQKAELLTFRAMEQRVLPPSKFNEFYKLFFDTKAPYRAPTLFHWHEAMTDCLRGLSLFRQYDSNTKLNDLCQDYINNYGYYA